MISASTPECDSGGRQTLAARIALAGIAGFIGLVLALHPLRPDYDPRRRFLSEFAVGPYAGLMTLAFFALGMGALGLAAACRDEMTLQGRRWQGATLFALAGADLFLVGLFPTDLQDAPKTWIGFLHNQCSTPPFLLILAAMALFWKQFRQEERWRSLMPATVLIGLAAVAIRTMTLLPVGLPWTGWTQRTLAALLLTWLLLFTLRLQPGRRAERLER